MSQIKVKASKCRTLQQDETFKEIICEIRQSQIDIFVNSSANIMDIEQAHTMIKALEKIESHIQTHIDAEKVLDKKNQ